MDRGLWAGVLLLAIGCQTAPTVPAEQIPPPSRASGSWVVVEDQRPDWERQPFTGRVTLFRPGKVYPSPWAQLAKEAEAVVAALPEKPERVDVTVVSFRLVHKDGAHAPLPDPSDNVRIGNRPVSAFNKLSNGPDYERLKSATQAGDVTTANAVGAGLVFQNGDPSVGVTAPRTSAEDTTPGALGEHPTGASCRVRAVVRVVFPGGREQQIDVQVVATGQNLSGSKYYGEALDDAVKSAVRQFGFQFRQGVGLVPG
jgi:hypothetical protein